MTIAIYHIKKPTFHIFGGSADAHFRQVCSGLVWVALVHRDPADEGELDDLDFAFMKTNHIDENWADNDGVQSIKGREHRSSSIGDIFLHYDWTRGDDPHDYNPSYWVCMPAGFELVNAERAEYYITTQIVDRWIALSGMPQKGRHGFIMDVEYTQARYPLRLLEFLIADDGNFGHDCGGIYKHFNRETHEMDNGFSPRYSV